MLETERLPPGDHSHAPAGEHLPPKGKSVERLTSYKSPVELLSAPSSGRVTIAGRRLGTGEVVQPEVIHLQDFPTAASSDAGGSATDAFDNATSSPSTPTTPGSVPTAASTSTAGAAAGPSSASQTIQETTKTSEQVYVTHATVAAAAAAAGGLVGGVHIPIRTAANVAEAALDSASVVDFDCASPTASAAAGSGSASTAAISPDTPAAGIEAAPPSSPGQQLQAEPDSPTGAPLAATTASTSHQGAAVQDGSSGEGGDGIAGHAVLPEDRDEVAATLQRLRITGQLPGPHSTTPAGPGAAAAPTPDTADLFVGTSTTATTSSSSDSDSRMSSGSTFTSKPSSGPASSSFAGAAGHPSAQGVSAGTAAPAKAGYPDPTSAAATVEPSPELSTGMQPPAGSSGGLLAMHDAAARAAAVAGALVHIGQPVTTAAALAGTVTQPAQAVEAASGLEESSPATSTAARVGSLHQQHTLAEFLLDESADAAISAEHRSDPSASAGAAGSYDDQPDLSAAAAAAAGRDDDVEVQLDVGRSTRLLGSDGRVAAAAAALPEEALAALQADAAGLSNAPSGSTSSSSKTPQHPSLRQLSLSSLAREQAQPTGQLPYGLQVADIVAATIASEEHRFRVMSPRSSPVGATSPRSGRDSFFTASSGSDPSTPRTDTPAPAVERSSSPLSASATRAIFESVQLAVQQEQLAGAVARSGSLGPVQQQATGPTAGGDAADASVTGRISSSGSGDSTATSSHSAAASESAAAAADPADAPCADVTGSSSSASGGPAAAAAAAVAEENAAVMQEMMLHELAEGTVAASAGLAVAEAESSASTASLCGNSDDYKAGAVSSTAVSEVPSSNVSAGDRLAAAVAAEAANDIGAAAAGMDVAATVAPAFPAVLFGPGPMPVDVAASRSPTSADSGTGSMGLGSAAADASEAAALTSAGMEALASPAAQDAIPVAVGVVSALQHVVDATSTAVISSAGMDGAAIAVATAASAATERHAGGADPVAAAQDAAQLVVDAARAVPGLLEPSEVASAAAAAGAAAAAAATPGMDAAAAAAACAAAAAASLTEPASVGAAAAQAVAAVDTDAAALPIVSTPVTSAGQTPSFVPISTAMQPPAQAEISQSGMVGLADSSSQGVQAATVDDLRGLLPILAPSGHVGDTVILTGPAVQEGKKPSAPAAFEGSSALLSTGAGGGAPAAADWTASAPGQLHSILEGSESGAAGSARGYLEPAADVSAATSAGGTTELLNDEGLSQSRMFDPLIVQLALASSVPLEGLGLDAALADMSGAVAGVGRDTSRSSSMARGSGTLMIQQHPLAGAESLGISTSLGPGPAEGGNVLTHLAAAAAAMSELDSKLQRQRTDSISLGAGYSSRPGELDAALAAMAGSAAAEAPAGPTDEGFEGDSSSVQV